MLELRLEGVPDGAVLSAGTRGADGAWVLRPEDLAGLTLMPPENFAGELALVLRATAREASGDVAVSEAGFTVRVAPVADPVRFAVDPAEGLEDSWIPLRGSLALTDLDGSEHLDAVLLVQGVPAGAKLSHGRETAPGTWSVPLAAFQDGLLAVLPPANSDVDFRLTLSATNIDQGGGAESRRVTAIEVDVVVRAVADMPDVFVTDLHGREDTPIRLDRLGGALRDTDGSEKLTFLLGDVPSGATIHGGTRQPDGTWLITADKLSVATLIAPPNFSGSFTLTLTAVATESRDGAPSARNSASFSVGVDPVVDNGTITVSIRGYEDTAIPVKVAFSTPDKDGSERWAEWTTISGMPADAALSQGVLLSDGRWQVRTAELAAGRISLLPPKDSDVDIPLTFSTVLSDSGNGKTVSRTIVTRTTAVLVGVADMPVAGAADVSGLEDQPIPLHLHAALIDTDGSEHLVLTLAGLPAGAVLSAGTRQPDGTWRLQPDHLAGLTVTMPRDYSGSQTLTFTARAVERDGDAAVSVHRFTVQTEAVADTPGLRVANAIGYEDQPIALRISGWQTDLDGSETIVGFRIANLPEGAVLQAGGMILAREPDGSVLVPPAHIGTLTVKAPPHSDRDFVLSVSSISAEPNGSRAESPSQALAVEVRAVADAPVITGTGGRGHEDAAIALDLSATLPDNDGSETLSFMVSGVPDGFRLSAGVFRGNNSWSLTAAQAEGLMLIPRADFAGTLHLAVVAISQEADGGSQARSVAVLPVVIEAVVDRPLVGGLDGLSGDWGVMRGVEDQPIALRLDPGLTDADGSERVVGSVEIGGVPEGAVLRLADGSVVVADTDGLYRIAAPRMQGVTLTMPSDSDEAATLSIRMSIEDTGGVRREIGGTMVVDPEGVADTPLLVAGPAAGTGPAGSDPGDGWIGLAIQAGLTDVDGSESLWLWVRDVPEGFTLSAGTPAREGVWLVPAEAIPDLRIRPAPGFEGQVALRLEAMSVEREGNRAFTGATLHLEVAAATASPGTPGGHGGAAPDATLPLLSASAEPGLEDMPVVLQLAFNGIGGQRGMLGLRIKGVPDGAALSAGHRDPQSGDWVLGAGELDGLSLLPPKDFSGQFTLTLIGVATGADGSSSSVTRELGISLAPVADAALIAVNPPAAREDESIPLNLAIATQDADGSESVVSILLSGLPSAARLTGDGVERLADGSWRIDPARLDGIELVPPPHFSGVMRFTVAVVTREGVDGPQALTEKAIEIGVSPVADAPLVTAEDVQGHEDRPIALTLGGALVDHDGSETLSLVLRGMPEGTRLSAGVNNGDGSWTLRPDQLAGLTLMPPLNWSGRMQLTLVGYAMEAADGGHASSHTEFNVHVAGVADMPLVDAGEGSRGLEGGLLAVDLRAQLADRDGSEQLVVTVAGVPEGGSFTAGMRLADGRWSIPGEALGDLGFRPPAFYSGTLVLGFTVTAMEADGDVASRELSMVFTVAPVTDAPILTLGAASGAEDSAILLPVHAALADTDGSEQLLRLVIEGVPAGATLSAGTHQGGGRWIVPAASMEGLHLTPPPHFSGTIALSVTAYAAERATGLEASTMGQLTLEVVPVADAPLLSVTDAQGAEDHAIALSLGVALADTDGSEQIGSITLSGLPAGFTLSAGRALDSGAWALQAADLPGLMLHPAPDWNGEVRLTLHAEAVEAANGDSSGASRDFTLSVAAVNDGPVVTLTPYHRTAMVGDQDMAAWQMVQVADVDSTRLSGARITLSGAHSGDMLAFEGFALHVESGRLFLGDTGIELRAEPGGTSLTLFGEAPIATYQAVLQSLVLETESATGLLAGTRSVSVVLRDDAGAESLRQSATLTVTEPPPAPLDEFSIGGGDPGVGMGWLELVAGDGGLVPPAMPDSWTEAEPSGAAAPGVLPDPLDEHVVIAGQAQAGDSGIDPLALEQRWS
ncbi:hypothetical protein ACFOD4_21635 [Pseudoroseomonas globiformis]|uniref:Tandem-95 repeat protein n=1 Tax=Teichococcus globiformis TaxID=2307229 RepID=A0ABV7G833_9PROT